VKNDTFFYNESGSINVTDDDASGKNYNLLCREDISFNYSAYDNRTRINGTFSPAVLTDKHFSSRTNGSGEITVDAKESVEGQHTLEPSTFPDN
jgi:hypothetical protein